MNKKLPVSVTLKSLLAAWVTMIFGTSLLLFLFAPIKHPVYSENFLVNILQSVWELGDAIGPIVKLSLIIIFAILVSMLRNNFNEKPQFVYVKSITFALLSMLLVLFFLPLEYSRGFGIGLTGSRIDTSVFFFYIIGAIAGGIVYAYTFNRLSKNV
ncbi:MAG: hypothetical protein V4721_17975 [Bacteroidota bacterium]